MKRTVPAILLLTLSTLGASVPFAAAQSMTYGPARGTLILAGGGPLGDGPILERFIELGGGREDGRFVIVPTAAGNRDRDGNVRHFDEERSLAPWRELGVRHVTLLHTHDPAVADTEEFVAPLREATAVWFGGGRQWNLVDSYAGTRTYDAFHAVLDRGGVIGGSSAGATIQGEYLVRGDTRGPGIVMTPEPNHQLGFEFLRRSAVDQHVDTRNRWNDLLPVMDAYPELLGLGLSESTAVVVTGDTFEVIGAGLVAVHDRTREGAEDDAPYEILSPGAVYDMSAREVVSGDTHSTAAARIHYLRARSNEAIAQHDAEAVVSFLDHEYTLTAGNGAFYPGHDNQLELWRETFARGEGVGYVRMPDRVEVGESGNRAAEFGRWRGRTVTDAGPARYTGHYAGYWRTVGSDWKIHAELFVTMTCDGEGCPD